MNQLAETTGANRESLRTEIARLVKEGKVVSTRGTRSPGGDKALAGRPPRLYRLAEDNDKVEALRQSILCFHDNQDDVRPNRPTGSVFRELHATLNRAMDCNATERENLLAQADHDLEFLYAMHEKSETTETFHAYLKMEELRLAYLRGQYGEIGAEFDHLADLFNRVGELEAAERAENFAAASRNRYKGEVSFYGNEIEPAAEIYASLTAGSSDPLIIIAKQFVRQLSDRYEQSRQDHKLVLEENFRLMDRLRRENLRFQDRLAQLKNAFAKMMEIMFARGAARPGRGAARVGRNPIRLVPNAGRHELNTGRRELSTFRSLLEFEWQEFCRDVCDRFAMPDDLPLGKYAHNSAVKDITDRDYFVQVLDDFVASTEASRSNQPGGTLMGGPPERAEFQLRAEQFITRARSPIAEENEKVWPWPFTQPPLKAAEER